MKIHEYQAKAISGALWGGHTARGSGLSQGRSARTAQRLKSNLVVVEGANSRGGRGKREAVKLARSADEAAEIASEILGMNLVTLQTGPGGRIVKRLLIEEGLDNQRANTWDCWWTGLPEKYFSWPARQAGWRSEEVAKDNPAASCGR